MKFRPKTLLAAAVLLFAATAMSARSGFTWDELGTIDKNWPQAVATTTGLRYIVNKEGTGATPRAGDTVKVLFRSMFFDGRVFDQATDPAAPFAFRLDRGELIPAWEEAIATMRVGEKRTLIVPAHLAYGMRGNPPHVPRQTSLVFEVEIVAVEPVSAPSAAPRP